MIENYFVCSLSESENSTVILLKNEQKFCLHIEEIA